MRGMIRRQRVNPCDGTCAPTRSARPPSRVTVGRPPIPHSRRFRRVLRAVPTLPSCRELSLFFPPRTQGVERLQRAGGVSRLVDASANGKLCRDPAPVKLTYASACNHAWLLQVTDVRGLVAQECDREGACGCILRALHDQGLCCLVCSQAPLRLLAACPVWIAHTHVHDGPGKRMGDATKGGR